MPLDPIRRFAAAVRARQLREEAAALRAQARACEARADTIERTWDLGDDEGAEPCS